MSDTPVRISMLSRPGCHLCVDARAAIERVLVQKNSKRTVAVLEEADISGDAALLSQYSEDIPVVLINGRRHSYWHVDEEKLSKAIDKAAKRNIFSRWSRN